MTNPQTIGEHFRKKRMEEKLSRKDVAKQSGVTINSVANWENSRTRPTVHLMPRIIKFIGYDQEIFRCYL